MKARTAGISRVLWQILFLNVVVAGAKAAWGILSGSTAMLADGIHSFTDGSGNVVALIAMKAATKPPDEDHPYGHHKYESFASAAIGLKLCFAAFRVVSGSVEALTAFAKTGVHPRVEVTAVSFAVMLITLAINIFVVWYETRRGQELVSYVLHADARHTLSYVWVTVGFVVSRVLV